MSANLTVSLRVGDFARSDFVSSTNEGNKTVTISSGATTADFTLPTVADSTDEPTGNVFVTVNSGTGYAVGNPGLDIVQVNDDDATTVTLSVPDTTAAEGSSTDRATVRLSLNRALRTSEQLAIPLAFSGGVLGTDFSLSLSGTPTGVALSNGTVTFTGSSGGSATSADVLLSASEDDDGVDETVTVSIPSASTGNGPILTATGLGGGATGSRTGNGQIVLSDDDTAGLVFSATSLTVAEGSSGSYTVKLASEPTGTVTVTVGGASGEVTVDTDSGTNGNQTTLTFSSSNWSTAQPVTVAAGEDVDTTNDSATLSHTATGGGYNSVTGNVAVTVTDDDTATPALSISGDGAVTEGSEAVFTVTASAAQGGSQRVLYILSDATGSDFLDDALEGDNSSFFFPRNETSYSLRIATTDDSVEEQSGDITVTLRLRNGSNYVLGSPFSATVRVNDDDSGTPPPPPEPVEPVVTLPRVSISGGGAVTEGGDAVFTLTVSPPPPAGETVTVAVQVSQSGRVVASGESGRRTVVVDDRGAASFTVTTSDDAIDEPDGAVIVTVRNGNGYRVGSRSSASVGVNDDDPGLVPSTVSLAVLRGGAGRFSLKLDTAPTATVAVTVSVSDGKGWMVDTDPGSPGKQTTLLFTPTNWNQPQEVVVSAGQEGEGVATVVINASGGDYEGLRAAIRVEVVEQDQGTATEAAKGWQVRFGRTVAQQVVDAVQDRLTAAPSPVGLHLTVAGEDLSGMPLEENEGALAKVLGFETVTTGQVMQDSAFSFSPPSPSPTAAPTAAPPAAAGAAEDGEGAEVGEGGGPRLAIWGGGALSSFRGTEQPLSLDGNVGTALLGADWRTERWQAGAALSHSWGNGSYTGEDDGHGAGKISSAVMTGLFPYGRYALSPRLGIWAVAGYGWGRLSVQPDDGSKREYQPDATMVMGAVGLDGLLIDGGTAGLSLSTTTDLLNLKTSTTAVDDLSSTEGNISRLRVGLEAVRPFPLPNDASLLPSLEVGIRHDGGDAESGFGLEVGAALAWHDPQRGISAELEGRSMVTHVEEEFRQQGLAVSFAWEPDPSNRGPSLLF